MKVTYRIGLQTFSEWICYDHDGFAKCQADNWVRFRTQLEMPEPKDIFQLYEWSEWLKRPSHVFVHLGDRFPEIKDVKFW